MIMDWLKRLFMGKDSMQTTDQKANKRGSKKHSQRVRAREKELRHGQNNQAAKKASFFWGSPGQTFQSNTGYDGRGK